MDLILLPFRLLAAGNRWASEQYRGFMSRFIVAVLGYLGILWIGAALDWPWLTVAVMWLASVVVFYTYLQPNIAGILGVFEWLSKSDDPEKASVIRTGLLLFISVVSAGGIALFFGAIEQAGKFPFAILVTLLVIACAVAVGGAHLEVWLPRISAIGVLMLVGATLWSAILSAPPEYLARVGIDLTAYKKRPSETVALDIAREDRNIRDQRIVQHGLFVQDLQRCAVPHALVDKFDKLQRELYKKSCSGPYGNMTLDEVRQGWDLSVLEQKPAARGGGGREGKSQEVPDWVPEFARDWGPVQWIFGTIGGVALLHVVGWPIFIALIGLFGYKLGKKKEAVAAPVAATLTTANALVAAAATAPAWTKRNSTDTAWYLLALLALPAALVYALTFGVSWVATAVMVGALFLAYTQGVGAVWLVIAVAVFVVKALTLLP